VPPEIALGLVRVGGAALSGPAGALGRRLGVGGLGADLPPPDHDPARAREAADQILSRDRYQWSDDRSLVERVGDWVSDQLGEIAAPFGVGGVPVWVGWLVLAALVAAIAFVVYRARGGWRRDRVADVAGAGRVVVAPGEEATDWDAEVVRCEAEGRWREALRARYRVLVAELARRRVIGDLVGRTAGELLADVRQAAPAAAPAFGAATSLFESAWYGGARVGPVERDRFAAHAEEALAAARGSSRTRVPA
jgi:hypothetical protein